MKGVEKRGEKLALPICRARGSPSLPCILSWQPETASKNVIRKPIAVTCKFDVNPTKLVAQ